MCRGNRNDFYSTARLDGCLGYLLDKDCYASLVVLLTQTQQSSLSYSRRLLLMFVKPGLHISLKDRKHMVGNVYFKVPKKRNFLFSLRKEHKKIGRLPFTVSQYLTWFQSYKALKMLKSRQKVRTRNMRFL